MINTPYEINRKNYSSKNKEKKKNRAEKLLCPQTCFSFWLLFFLFFEVFPQSQCTPPLLFPLFFFFKLSGTFT